MKIPFICHDERMWWENIGRHTSLKRSAGSREITFMVEQTRDDCVHACTVDDICYILSLVPRLDVDSLDTVVLRQSTRKQWLLDPTWGRLAYSAEVGRTGKKPHYSGPVVFLEATNPGAVWKWDRSLSPSDSAEMERLKADGHVVEDTGKWLLFHSSMDSVRATQLYRTLLHEIGHWVDWLDKVVRPSENSSTTYDVLSERYFARPEHERELFAHRYADALRKLLVAQRLIPFPRISGPPGDREVEAAVETATRSHS